MLQSVLRTARRGAALVSARPFRARLVPRRVPASPPVEWLTRDVSERTSRPA